MGLRTGSVVAVLVAALTAGAQGTDDPTAQRERLDRLEAQDRARRKEFDLAARRGLPAKAAERLARARQAYDEGQGRLIQLLRSGQDPQEVQVIQERLQEAARREPISAGDLLKVKAPVLTAPPLTKAEAPARDLADDAPDAAAIGAVPAVLQEAAAALDGPVAVFEWVRNNIRPELYYGSMKGPVQTYLEASGNDADTAAVLVEMLRAKGIPARYVRGTAQVPAATLTAIVGTTSVEQAVRALERAGIPHQVVPGGSGVAAVAIERVFVEAYVPYANYRGATVDAQGKAWIPLDPHFKRLEPVRGLDVVEELGFGPRALLDGYLAQTQPTTPLEQARARVTALLAEQRPGVSYADALNRRFHVHQILGLLPSSLPYPLVARHDVAYSLDDTLRHKLRIVGETADGTILDATVPLSDVLGKRFTVSYLPFDEDDRAVVARYGAMHLTPPYLFEVKPVLKSSGVAIAAGTGPVGMAVRYTLRFELLTPGGTTAITNRVLAGNLLALGLGGAHSQGAPPAGETAAQVLDTLSRGYLQRWNEADEELANLLRVVPLRPMASACLVTSDVQVEYAGGDPSYPLDFVWKGILIDADLRASAPVALSRSETRDAARDFLLLSGLMGSVLEQRIFQDGLQIPAVSTASALGLAPAQGVAVLDITQANVDAVLPSLPFDALVKAEIEEAARRGLLARVPASNVTRLAWTGVGYLLLDEATGEAAYQLQGGHSGGVTAPSVIEIPEEIRDPLIDQDEEIAPAGSPVARIEKFTSTDFQAGTVNQLLQKPFKVLVTDPEGHPVPQAPVTFHVIGGEGSFVDLLTGDLYTEMTVLSSERGEAEALLVLGTKTDLIPRYIQLEGEEYQTQVGLNVVTVTSGEASLRDPFLSWGYPDDRFDGTNRFATLTNMSPDFNPFVAANLTVGGTARIAVDDPFGNPISNIPVRVAYKPIPVQWEPCTEPGACSHLRPPTTTPGHVLKGVDYAACAAATPRVLWGQCPGEAEEVVVNSSFRGAFAYALLGDSPGSFYNYEVTSTAHAEASIPLKFATWAFVCRRPRPEDCGAEGLQPWEAVNHGTRVVRTNRLGNMIEAYPTGGVGDLTVWADALYEDARLIPEVQPDNSIKYRAEGTNTYRLEPLTTSEFSLAPGTAGTAVSPPVAPHVGQGQYSGQMTMAAVPQLNTARVATKHYPDIIHYLPDQPLYVDPAYIVPGTPPTVRRAPDPARPWRGPFDFDLWGAEVALTELNPTPVIVGADRTVERASSFRERILPAEWGALLDGREVFFEIRRGEERVASAAGAHSGGFKVPQGMPFPPASYTAHLSVLGIHSPDGKIESDPFPIPGCHVVDLLTPQVTLDITRDPVNNTTCSGDEKRLAFYLCRASKVTLKVDGDVLTAPIDGGPPVTIAELALSAGVHRVSVAGGLIGQDIDKRVPFTVEGEAIDDAELHDTATGEIINSVRNRSVLPVGRTYVKGVDLLDGHVVQSAKDLSLQGRHLGLEVMRTYSSTGRSREGLLGAGWGWNYGSYVHVSPCGVVVVTASGDSQLFRSPDGGNTFIPQKGYHTRLVRNGDSSYDFFDKAGNRHHFREPEDAENPLGARRLEYIVEPHGDRLNFSYDVDDKLKKVAEVHPESPEAVRALEIEYVEKAGHDRVSKVSVPALQLQVDYGYDEWGNLVTATRSGRNIAGGADAASVVWSYGYSTNVITDRHQLLSVKGPNTGNKVEYVYYAPSDVFLGESPTTLIQRKEEYVKEVRERGSATQTFTTSFEFDYREVTGLRFKCSVRDPRGNPTLYVLNGNGSALEIHEPLGKSTYTTWATDDIFKLDEKDALGRVTTYGHDGRGNLTSERINADLGAVETLYQYDPTFNKLTFKRDGEGRETRYEVHSGTGDLLSVTDAVGNVTRNQYDGHGRLESVTDPRQHTTLHANHDSFGNARTVTDPLGNVTTREYDDRGRLTRQTDTLDRETITTYDGLDRTTSVRRVAGGESDDDVTETSYYPEGQPESATNANGATTLYLLDGLDRVTEARTFVPGAVPPTLTTVTAYDGNGNKETETDRRGVKRKFTHDALNRLRKVEVVSGLPSEGPSGTVATFDYDRAGNKTLETDVSGNETHFEYDGLYRLEKKVLPQSPFFERYVNDKVGNRRSFFDANGKETKYEYDGLNRLTKTTNALGQIMTVAYDDPEGSHVNKSQEHDQTHGLRTTYLYDELNRELERTVHLEGAGSSGETYTTATSYQDAAHSLTVKDPRQTDTVSKLDGLDRVIEQAVDPTGLNLVTHIAYDGLGNRKSVLDPEGHSTSSRHDGLGRLAETIDDRGQSSLFTYDGEGHKLSETDRRGVRRDFTYDNLGRPRKATLVPRAEMSGVAWSQESQYLDGGRQRHELDARGKRTVFQLDGLGRVLEETDHDSHVRRFTYDGVNKRSETDKRPAHHQTLFAYDDINRLVETTFPILSGQGEPSKLLTDYQDVQNRRVDTDRRGIPSRTQMDSLGRVRSVTRAVGREDEAVLEANDYDGNGNKTHQTDAEGKKTAFVYDRANRLESRTDGFESAVAATTAFEYDKDGLLLKERDQRAADLSQPFSISRGYDTLHRLTSETDGLNHSTAYDYDNEGNRTFLREPEGQETTFAYDELGKLTTVTQPSTADHPAPVTRYAYDPNRNLIRTTDAKGRVVERTYDNLNRLDVLTQRGAPEGDLTTDHGYDENGSLTTLRDPKGQLATSSYDEWNRLKTKSYAFAPGDASRPWRHTTAIVYAYDPNGNLLSFDESVATGTDPPVTLTTSRTYDDLDRLKSETTPQPTGGSKTVSYSYFKNGTRKTVTGPGTSVTTYAYDGQNRLETATTAAGATIHTYWPDDLLRTIAYPNGVVATHGYDLADRLTSLTNARGGTTVSSYTYDYWNNGNRKTQTEINGGLTETTSYTYDNLNRLKTVTYPIDTSFPTGRVVTYGYDAVGNRVSETTRNPGGTVLADKQGVFDSLNRLTALNDLVTSANSLSFGWDRNGNQTRKTIGALSTEYRYDTRNQLVEVAQGTLTPGRFQYDAQGRRLLKIGEEGLRQYVYDQTSLLAEYNDTGLEIAKYDYGSDRLISLTRGAQKRYYLFDALRSVTNLTDEAGATQASYHLDPWGNFRFPSELNSSDTAASKNRFAFTGYLWDQETALYYAKARFYDPEVGRFTSQDSFLGEINDPPSLHRYFYGNANPLRYIDPTGHQSEPANDPISLTPEEIAQSLQQDLAASTERRLAAEAEANQPIEGTVHEEGLFSGLGRWYSEKREGFKRWARDHGGALGRKLFDPTINTERERDIQLAVQGTGPAQEGAAADYNQKRRIGEGVQGVSEDIGAASGDLAAEVSLQVGEGYVGGKIGGGIVTGAGRGRQVLRNVARGAEETIELDVRAGQRAAAAEAGAARRADDAIAVGGGTPPHGGGAPSGGGGGGLPPGGGGPGGGPPSGGSTALVRVGDQLITVQDVLANPSLLKGQGPADAAAILGNTPGWRVEKLGKGTHQGQGWVLREYTPRGDATGRSLRWHPGGGHHGPDPYWRVTGGADGKSGIIPAGPEP